MCSPLVVVAAVVGVVAAALLALGLYTKATNARCLSRRRLDGRTALVTGGTAGIGLQIALGLAERGARVVVACPWPAEGERARALVARRAGAERALFLPLDLASLASVREFARRMAEVTDRLDVLVNNAGVGAVRARGTRDRLGLVMQVNYFGHFLLTLLLLPLLRRAGTVAEPARVVNATSLFHHFASVDFAAPGEWRGRCPLRSYADSKLCLALFAREFARREGGGAVVATCADPGVVGTGIFRCAGAGFGSAAELLLAALSKTPREGAETALHAALAPEGAASGRMFRNCREVAPARRARDDAAAARLWEASARLVGLGAEEEERLLRAAA